MKVKKIAAVATLGVLVACVPPKATDNATSVQQWACETECYDWTEQNGQQLVKGGDARMYYFAASHDPSVALVRGPYNS